MTRVPSTKRKEALEIWLKSGREKKPKQIAEELNVSAGQIRKWKCIDKWEEIPISKPARGAPAGNQNAIGNKGGIGGPPGNKKAVGNKGGAPLGSKNALGNKGGAPLDNQNAFKHGLFSKWLPDNQELRDIYEAARDGMSTLDILYEEILIGFTNFIRAQKIMFVKDQDDMTKELKKEKFFKEEVDVYDDKGKRIGKELAETEGEREYEIQFAWDKQAKALTAQAAAMRALSNKIKQYEEMIRTLPPEEVNEEHRLRISKLKVDIDATKKKFENNEDDKPIEIVIRRKEKS